MAVTFSAAVCVSLSLPVYFLLSVCSSLPPCATLSFPPPGKLALMGKQAMFCRAAGWDRNPAQAVTPAIGGNRDNNGKLVEDRLSRPWHRAPTIVSRLGTRMGLVRDARAGGQGSPQRVGRLVGCRRDLFWCRQSRGALGALPSGHGGASQSCCP